ncbi:MAG: hypothetical protein E7197_01690 [Anaerovibrio sp.]|uniref:cyclophilin-like fold protein n=1 Tax=Anaerovibrio sp. TaxID=1872532 RepID=UPI0025BCFC1F|nr:cyclophilin-like fold protein [Anaerovibrio sp.]MBE6098747.1 hypothetical protein [Anaerovibrio sp.]
MIKSKILGVAGLTMLLLLSGCLANQTTDTTSVVESHEKAVENNMSVKLEQNKEIAMNLMIDNTVVPVSWEQNASTEELKKMLPLTINMSMYGGFEQVGSIGHSLTRNDKQTTTQYGDIVLYSGDKIVIFYGSNSWSYTRLGHIDLSQEKMTDLLSHGNVTIRITE